MSSKMLFIAMCSNAHTIFTFRNDSGRILASYLVVILKATDECEWDQDTSTDTFVFECITCCNIQLYGTVQRHALNSKTENWIVSFNNPKQFIPINFQSNICNTSLLKLVSYC